MWSRIILALTWFGQGLMILLETIGLMTSNDEG